MNNGKIKIFNYKDMIVIDLYSPEQVTRDDIHWLSDSMRQKYKRKQ